MGAPCQGQQRGVCRVLTEALEATDAVIGNDVGNAVSAIDNAARRIEAVYSYPHQNHACMETMNATVKWTPNAARPGCRPRTARRAGWHGRGGRSETGAMRGVQDSPRRRLRPPRWHRLRPQGGTDRQRNARCTDQDDLVP